MDLGKSLQPPNPRELYKKYHCLMPMAIKNELVLTSSQDFFFRTIIVSGRHITAMVAKHRITLAFS